MAARLAALACWLVLLAAVFTCAPVQADTDITLFKSYAGNLNFVGTQRTLRTQANGSGTSACLVTPASSTVTAALAGIPAGATVISAQLYWAGSGSTPDYDIVFEGAAVSASPVRQFTSSTVGYNYFSGAADVTAQVKAKRNGTYSFSGSTVDTSNTYCAVEGVLGGFSLLVLYTLPTETFRVLNLYEGFKYIRDTVSLTLTLTNFRIPTPLPATSTGRVAHITWEGDKSISGGGEDLFFNGVALVDAMNTSGNQFNSSSNINNDANSHGIDFDAYTLSSQITAGQTSATTLYRSGQDLVMLSAEVVAVPNVAVADLEVLLAVSGIVSRGQTVTFTHTVNSLGPSTESGPVKITQTLPTGMTYVSGSGSNWTCSASGQSVTCLYAGAIASGASAPDLSVRARIASNSPDSMSTSTTVAGAQFDNFLANNTASKTVAIAASTYVFTNKPCVSGLPFSELTCAPITWDTRVAGTTSNVYITAVDSGGTPFSPRTGAVAFQFAVSCHDPVTAVSRARFDSQTMPQCAGSGAVPSSFLSRSYTFSGLSASVGPYPFYYGDVGKMELFLKSPLGTYRTDPFVYVPNDFLLTSLTANPAAASTADTIGVYVRAGAPFGIRVQAVNLQGELTPNFGREQRTETVKLTASIAAAPGGKPAYTEMNPEPPDILGAFVPFSGGAASGAAFSWNEVGIINVLASIYDGNYLDAGDVVGKTSLNLGRFIPDHFDTEVPIVMACPATLACNGTGMHYSAQPIGTGITARGALDAQMKGYQGRFARTTALTGASGPGLSAAPASGALDTVALASAAFVEGVGGAAPRFTLPALSAPQHVSMRAIDSDGVSSLRGSDSEEGGTKVALGRLQISNEFGSELLPLKVNATAQYWGDTKRWQNSTTDNQTSFAKSSMVASNVAPSAGSTLAKANIKMTADTPASVGLASGAASFRIFLDPALNKQGKADIDVGAPDWLPRVGGRMTFGAARSTPLIYIREVF